MTGAVRAEWTKARSLPSTGWLVCVVALGMVALGLAVTGTLRVDECGDDPCVLDTVRLSLAGVQVAQVGAAVLGVLLVTGEYATGTIRPSLVAVPRREQVLAAKVVVVGALTTAGATVGVVGALLVARSVLPSRGFTAEAGYPQSTLLHDLTQRAAVGTVLYLVLVALLGAGIGLLVRDTGVAVTMMMAVLFLGPVLALFVSDPDWQGWLHRYAPTDAGLAVQATRDLASLRIAPWPGLALVGGYAAAVVLAGGVALRRRDA
ncbi:hypothetical protein [Cellulomonas sp.]|uniref:hypothetical protein n=1 Tax=Cellulomonas sp. TaxID=40001 RepID=UPI003BAD9820